MSKPNHKVVLAGKVFTNASPRTYTHAVVGSENLAYATTCYNAAGKPNVAAAVKAEVLAGKYDAKVLAWCQSAAEAGERMARYAIGELNAQQRYVDLAILPVQREQETPAAVARQPVQTTYALALDNRIQAFRLLGEYTRGHFQVWDLAGPHNVARRAQLLGFLAGRVVPQREAGVTAFRRAFYEAAGLDMDADTLSGLERRFVEMSRRITENNSAGSGNVPAGSNPLVPNAKDRPMASKKSPAASKKSDVKTEAAAAATPAAPKADKPAKAKKAPKADKVAEKPAEAAAAKPAMQEWPEGYTPYILEGTERIELLSKDQVASRNANREKKDKGGRWVARPDADPAKVAGPFMNAQQAVLKMLAGVEKTANPTTIATATKVVESVVKIELGVAEKEGNVTTGAVGGFYKLTEKGKKVAAEIPAFLKYPPPTPRKVGSTTEQQKAEVKPAAAEGEEKPAKQPKAPKADKPARPEWNGLGMCELIRYCGSKGLNKAQINAVCGKAGFAPSKTTIAIQSKKGVDGENVPAATKDAAAEVKAWAAEVPAAEPKAKKVKADKPAKERVKVTADVADEEDAD